MGEVPYSFEDDKLILVNALEDCVKSKVKETIRELGACNCEACYLNACALALNSLKPQYVTTPQGEKIFEATSMKQNNQTEIIVAVTHAVQQVMRTPYHKNIISSQNVYRR